MHALRKSSFILFIISLCLISSPVFADQEEENPAFIILSPEHTMLMVGDQLKFSADVYDSQGEIIPSAGVDWSIEGDIGEIVNNSKKNALFLATNAEKGKIIASAGDCIAEAEIMVIGTNNHPVIITAGLPDATEGDVYDAVIEATDPDAEDILTFSLTDGPGWLEIDGANGALSGTPSEEDVGKGIMLTVRVTDSGSLFDEAFYTIDVLGINEPPEIVTGELPDATEGEVYEAVIEATDPDAGDILTFALKEGPGWLSIDDATGILSGTPLNDDVDSEIEVIIQVTDGEFIDEATYEIDVLSVNEPPEIVTAELPDATEAEAYYAEIQATDPDEGDILTFSLTDNPEWLEINDITGVLSGTPSEDDVETGIIVTVRVTDNDGIFDEVSYTIDVLGVIVTPEIVTNTPPVIVTEQLPSATDGVLYTASIEATDPENDENLTYSIIDGPLWLETDTETGVLSGTPSSGDIGSNITVIVRVTDSGGLFDEATYTIEVKAAPSPEVYTFTVNEGETYVVFGIQYPLDFLNGMKIYFPPGSLYGGEVTINFTLPRFALADDDLKQVFFEGEIITGVSFEVFVDGEVVSPYYFGVPVHLTLPYDEGSLAELGMTAGDLGMFFVNFWGELDPDGITGVSVNESAHVITGYMAHFSDIAVAPVSVPTAVGDDTKPAGYELAQNYPNPFNPATTIPFRIPETSRVTITIFSILGQQVRTLIDEVKPAGRYAVVWDGIDDTGAVVTAGTYIYRIRAGEFSESRKLMFVK